MNTSFWASLWLFKNLIDWKLDFLQFLADLRFTIGLPAIPDWPTPSISLPGKAVQVEHIRLTLG